ncbi:nuclear transport factor 2 family protein [Streptomyces sp. NPDC002896]|uniref:nuclear transport factor 2 family protein n=1 Tax=Streptomyces sp. NPDC002896 TaxID=3154438 RepID=UPI00332291C9
MTTNTRLESDAQTHEEAVESVRDAIGAYCHALDDGRVDDLVALFTADGVSALPGMEPVEGHDALRQLYRGLTPQAPQRHLVVNTVVTEQGDRATALSDLVFLARGESGWAVSLVGRYEDVLRRENGRWRFARRSLSFAGA